MFHIGIDEFLRDILGILKSFGSGLCVGDQIWQILTCGHKAPFGQFLYLRQ